MISYLWIGLGGALGSMARAWTALAVARITGPQFPWGTILINIAGSFIIGFFGTLTANDSRFAVPADARAFVMVGICGGFTTFSSFSLQTLDLARDGRVLQALGNVGLSVAMCLLAVAAGHYGAAAVQRGRTIAAVSGPAVRGEVVVAVLDRPAAAGPLLEAGGWLLELGGGGRLEALAVRMPLAASILPSEEVLTADREDARRAEEEDWAGQLRRVVEAWGAVARDRGVQTDWIDAEGDAADIVTEHGRRADAVIVRRPGPHEGERMHACLHAALFATSCPVLVVPSGFRGLSGRDDLKSGRASRAVPSADGVIQASGHHGVERDDLKSGRPSRFLPSADGVIQTSGPHAVGAVVAIAWKDDERAARAVRGSLPLLRAARAVHVLCADSDAEVPPVLQEHGIGAAAHRVPDGAGTTGERLLRAAHEVGADLLVMGAFAHGEWRERMFGGVTRTMLASADIPLLMRH